MFNFSLLKKIFLVLIRLLEHEIWLLPIKFNLYTGLALYNLKKFYYLQQKELKYQLNLLIIKYVNTKTILNWVYNISYFSVSLFIVFWPLKDTGFGLIIIKRYVFYSAIFTFDTQIYLERDIDAISDIVEFFIISYFFWILDFSFDMFPFIVITIYFSKIILLIWMHTIRISFIFFHMCFCTKFAWIGIKFIWYSWFYVCLNLLYHSLLCIAVIQDYYITTMYNTFELLFLILCVIEVYCTDFIYFLLNQFNSLLSWATNSYFYLIINLLIELITKTIPKFTISLINNFVYFIKQISYIKNPLYVIILNLVVIILFILIGGIIPLVERKYLSLIQRRVGPKFVGYSGRLQFIADALKLLFKEIIFLINTNKVSFVVIPIFLLNLNIFLLINLVWVNNLFYIDNEYFILLILLIELITSIYTAYIGFVVKNKYTIIASTRLINGVIVFEIFLITIYFYLYIINSKLNLDNIYFNQIFNVKLKLNLIILPPIVYAVLLNLKKVPFDIIEAETELIMGYTTEHSGFLGGALLLIEYLHLFFWSLLILTLFLI